jgi:hypothetical protein
MLKTIKILTIAPTYFSSLRNNHQCLPLPCTARLHNRLVCRHDTDHVINDEHNRIIIVVLAKHEIAP